jgi:Holliday junction resolvase RusA-like endonuclease
VTLLHEQEFAWKPKVKSRPAVNTKTRRAYTPKATREAERSLADQYDGPLLEGFLRVEYVFENERIVMRVFEADDYVNRKLRGDVDNYQKLANDALNKVAWKDDRQIVDLRGRKL